MHRILLYALVVVLLALAWNARLDRVLASAQPEPSEDALAAAPGPATTWTEQEPAGPPADFELQARLEARVETAGELWARLGLEAPAEPRAETVLAGAEAWLEAQFPEGGSTARPRDAEDRRDLAPLTPGDLLAGAGELALPGSKRRAGDDFAAGDEEPAIYVAALARIESLSGDRPAWCGLLDLALTPGAPRPDLGSGGSAWAPGDTAWISDERGNLLARVEALDGFGLELDPTWPWVARQRRLFWADGGGLGLSARQYRLVLGGDPLMASWVGRLVLIRSQQLPPYAPPALPTRR